MPSFNCCMIDAEPPARDTFAHLPPSTVYRLQSALIMDVERGLGSS
jgi:hypothetical protein